MVVKTINKKINKVNCWQGGNGKGYIVIHDVGIKGQTAKNNIDYFNSGYIGASAHYFVDRTSIWQLIEDNDRAWHVGDGNHPSINNSNSIGIEMIVEKDGTIHEETKANAKWLANMLQKKYNIPNSKIVRHYDASGKNCPHFLNRDGKWTEWKEFYKYVTTEEDVKKPVETSSYKVVKTISGFKTAADAKANKNKVSSVASGTYYIYKKADGMYNVTKTKGKAGSWINPNHNVVDKKTYHTVKSGDTLWAISQKYNTTVANLQKMNGLNNKSLLQIGQKLIVKG